MPGLRSDLSSCFAGITTRWRRTRDAARPDTFDVVASTFLVAWRRLDEVPADSLPWLGAVARNVIATQQRGSRRRTSLRFTTYELLPANDSTEAWLSLTAQHPSAIVDRNQGDYVAAEKRLFPNG